MMIVVYKVWNQKHQACRCNIDQDLHLLFMHLESVKPADC